MMMALKFFKGLVTPRGLHRTIYFSAELYDRYIVVQINFRIFSIDINTQPFRNYIG